MQTGYFGNKSRFTKTHIVIDDKPICGCKIGKDMQFQWCCNNAVRRYVECRNCLRRLDDYLDNRSKI